MIEHVKTMLARMEDNLDHPEIWAILRENAEEDDPQEMRVLYATLDELVRIPQEPRVALLLQVLHLVVKALCVDLHGGGQELEQLSLSHSQNVLVTGALFFVQGLIHPENPKFQLAGRYCDVPFDRIDILEQSAHQCCASFLPTSVGNLRTTHWEEVWNSPAAKAVRESIHDGSYRHCNKILCPAIQGGTLPSAEQMAKRSDEWKNIIAYRATHLPRGPRIVNMSYDRTCNLSCPSCRSEKFAANAEMRIMFDTLQDRNVIPMLKTADLTYITGSGDPFASKNFRNVLKKINKEEFPSLKVQLMTNGMLFTPSEWEKFPNLKHMISLVRVSIDAARGPTHELLRRGAKWDVMLENMEFIGKLRAKGEIDGYGLAFVIQQENFREMGEAVDLARQMGADHIHFSRISNWGTFSNAEFQRKCIFVDTHPDYQEFLECMADPRLQDPIVLANGLDDFRSVAAAA